jgi:hypothetical protein
VTRLCIFRAGVCETSGQHREEVYDARGIFVAFVCGRCRQDKLGGYRADIFSDPHYPTDEEIEP